MRIDLSVTPEQLLGQGGESAVYAVDQAHVLRLYHARVPDDYIARRHAFYAWLHAQQPPFEIPEILEHGIRDDRRYSVERRMGGRAFAAVLPALRGADRQRTLASYLDVAAQIGTILLPAQPWGELITTGTPLQRATWAEFAAERLQQAYQASRSDLEQDVPNVAAVLAQLHADLLALPAMQAHCLVHGDYFPGNVFLSDQLTICGVGDFGYTTIVGDPRLDLAGAVGYVELSAGYRPADTTFLRSLVMERHGRETLRWLDVYRHFSSFYFSGCKADDPQTYRWCITNLRAALQAPGARSPQQ